MWKADHDLQKRFDESKNRKIIRYLKRNTPSAHGDLVDALFAASNEIENRQIYCPDAEKFAYFLLHTVSGVIYAVAIGMHALAFRLPEGEVSKALSSGGTKDRALGKGWVSFEAFPQGIPGERVDQELKLWCECAYQNALRGQS
jgi:hypothetical protein